MANEKFEISDAVYVKGNKSCYRGREHAQITGVYMGRTSIGAKPILCYQLQFFDQERILVPVSDVGPVYKMKTFSQVLGMKNNSKL